MFSSSSFDSAGLPFFGGLNRTADPLTMKKGLFTEMLVQQLNHKLQFGIVNITENLAVQLLVMQLLGLDILLFGHSL